MADETETPPSFLSSLPSQPITEDVVKQIGESDNPNVRGAMGFPGSTPGAIEAFLLKMDAKAYVIVFDPSVEQWHVYDSFETAEMSRHEIVDAASELVNEWLRASFSERIAAADTSERDT